VSTFAFDLALLAFLLAVTHLHYALLAGIAYGIAVSINYLLSRRFVFAGTERAVTHGYVIFLGIAGVGLVAVSGLMVVLVEYAHLPPLVARVGIAGVVGLWNYLMNLFVNFKVAGKH
jgi:putative flippase GtrA